MIQHLETKMRFSRMHNTGTPAQEDTFEVEITDERSGIRIVTATIPLSQVGALIGQGMVLAHTELQLSPNIGRKHETKKVVVPTTNQKRGGEDWPRILREIVAPLEVDGWKAKIEQFNHHYAGFNCYEVTFDRWVD